MINFRKGQVALVLSASLLLAGFRDKPLPTPTPNSQAPTRPMATSAQKKLRLTVGTTVLTATLYDNATTRDFIALLPLTLTLRDYHSTEKISDLPHKLSTQGAPAGHGPAVGDLTYYAPWGNLALFYKEFSYSTGLISLGKLNGGVEALKGVGPVEVKMELVP